MHKKKSFLTSFLSYRYQPLFHLRKAGQILGTRLGHVILEPDPQKFWKVWERGYRPATQTSCPTTIPFLRSVNKYTQISTQFQQLLATAGSVKSQQCTQSHPLQPKDIRFPRVANAKKNRFSTKSSYHLIRAAFYEVISYQGTRPQSHSNSELKLALSCLSDV